MATIKKKRFAIVMGTIALAAAGSAHATIDYTLPGLATEVVGQNGVYTETDNLPGTVYLSFDPNEVQAGCPCDVTVRQGPPPLVQQGPFPFLGEATFTLYQSYDPTTHVNDLSFGYGEIDQGEEGSQYTAFISADIKFDTPTPFVIGAALPAGGVSGSEDIYDDFMMYDSAAEMEVDTSQSYQVFFGPTVPAVPEPSAWTFLLAGLCGIGAASLTRSRKLRVGV